MTNHTIVNGRRQHFDGTGGQLFGKRLLWNFLTIITLFIYAFWKNLKMKKWEIKHTHFEDSTFTAESEFKGGLFALTGLRIVVFLVTIFTFTLGFWPMCCLVQRWYAKNTIIDGQKLAFDGKGSQLFLRGLLWTLLSVVTIGIWYVFCFGVAKKKWITKHLWLREAAANNPEFDASVGAEIGDDKGSIGQIYNNARTSFILAIVAACSVVFFTFLSFISTIITVVLLGVSVAFENKALKAFEAAPQYLQTDWGKSAYEKLKKTQPLLVVALVFSIIFGIVTVVLSIISAVNLKKAMNILQTHPNDPIEVTSDHMEVTNGHPEEISDQMKEINDPTEETKDQTDETND